MEAEARIFRRLEKLRENYKENKACIKAAMKAVAKEKGLTLASADIDKFFSSDMKPGTDYYQAAVTVAKALCGVAEVVCPYIKNLP